MIQDRGPSSNFMNPTDLRACIHLFDLALQAGFTSMHSFLMFKQDLLLLETAYMDMESSDRYSAKQLEFVSTMLIVKPIHEHLMKQGKLVSEYDDNDKKRYTHVLIESESDDPLLKSSCINWSENGLKTGGPERADDLADDHDQVMAWLSEGDHLIRYMNVPYFLRYSEATWVPVLLRNGKLFDPSPFT